MTRTTATAARRESERRTNEENTWDDISEVAKRRRHDERTAIENFLEKKEPGNETFSGKMGHVWRERLRTTVQHTDDKI